MIKQAVHIDDANDLVVSVDYFVVTGKKMVVDLPRVQGVRRNHEGVI